MSITQDLATLDADVDAAWNAKPDYQTTSDARMVTTAVNTLRKIAVEHYPAAAVLEIVDVSDLYLAPSRILDAAGNVLWSAARGGPLFDALLACVMTVDRFSPTPVLLIKLAA